MVPSLFGGGGRAGGLRSREIWIREYQNPCSKLKFMKISPAMHVLSLFSDSQIVNTAYNEGRLYMIRLSFQIQSLQRVGRDNLRETRHALGFAILWILLAIAYGCSGSGIFKPAAFTTTSTQSSHPRARRSFRN